jgi:hypothetical protein
VLLRSYTNKRNLQDFTVCANERFQTWSTRIHCLSEFDIGERLQVVFLLRSRPDPLTFDNWLRLRDTLTCRTETQLGVSWQSPTMSRPYLNAHLNHDHNFSTPLPNMYWNAVYYPNWRIYRDQPPVSLNYDVISHVFYAFAW